VVRAVAGHGELTPVVRRRIGRGLVLAVAGVVGALHAVRPELDPLAHRLSDYANGDHGWLMAVAFALMAAAALVMAPLVAAAGRTPRRRRAMRAAMVVAAFGLAAAGIFRTGAPEAGVLSDQLHALTSSAAAIALVAAAVLSGRRVIGALAVVLLVTSPLLHHTAVAGLDQRVLWAVVLVWLVTSAPAHDHIRGSSGAARTMVP
jgi:hypothetical protein